MITPKDLLEKLHDSGMIDKRFVLWWQLGFEGRRVYGEEEFEANLRNVKKEVYKIKNGDFDGTETKNFPFWTSNEVPILLRDCRINDFQVPCFISIKPLSHETRNIGHYLEEHKKPVFPPSIYLSPHIRGIVLESTPEFLFWTPFILDNQNCYSTMALESSDLPLPILFCPIEPTKFYKNIINKIWSKGKRAQKRATSVNLTQQGRPIVPYYDFNPGKNQATIYPSRIFYGKLSAPTILLGQEGERIPKILGAGYFTFGERAYGGENRDEEASFWELDSRQLKLSKDSLITRLGRI